MTKLRLEDLPDFVVQAMQQIAMKFNIPLDELLAEYEKIFFLDYIQKDPTFTSDTERHLYAVKVLKAKYIYSPLPMKKVMFVPIGTRGIRISQTSKEKHAILYGFIINGEAKTFGKVVIKGSGVENVRNISFYDDSFREIKLRVYETYLSPGKNNVYFGDARTKFDKVKGVLDVSIYDVLESLKVKRIKIAEAYNNLSEVLETGFVNDMDLRVIRGIITRKNIVSTPSGTQMGVYVIVDDSVPIEEQITENGEVIQPGLTVWLSPELMIYDEYSECDFVGILRRNKKGLVVMDAILVIPIHARLIQQEEVNNEQFI